MGSFHRTNIVPEGFIRGAARLLVANYVQPFPTRIQDVLVLTAGATQYDSVSGWSDLGATKTGVNVARNNTEETFDVDQITSDIASQPTGWDMSVGTALAEVTLQNMVELWENGPVTIANSEKRSGMGAPESYTRRRLAVVFKRPDLDDGSAGKIRLFVFRKVQRTPQDSSFTFQKTGEQQVLPHRWKALADDVVSDVDERFGLVFDQV
jgi:hypothetical protein